jgi:aspartyl/glutamyl-tRNA(Asn/Gln) amidotransferase C subunit
MISKEEVEHIAKLARLELTEKEIEKMQKDLSAILDYFDLLKSASVPSKEDYGETKKANMFRKDEVVSSYDMTGDLVEAAPDKKDGYIKVKAIL